MVGENIESTLQNLGLVEEPSELDILYEKMSAFVSEHGPLLLTRGMPPLEANTAIMACLEHLFSSRVPFAIMAQLEEQKNAEEKERRRLGKKVDIARRIIELLLQRGDVIPF